MTRSISRGPWFRFALFVLVLLAAWLVARTTGTLDLLQSDRLPSLIREVRRVAWAAPAFVLTYAVVATVGLPATPLTLAGGALFGPWLGTCVNWLGATLGATGAYLLARTLGRDAVRSLLGARAGALDALAGDQAFGSLLRLRLLPIVPFNGINFGAGLAGVRPGSYVLATALGIVPGTAVYTYFADALLAGVDGAREAALVRVAIAGVLLVLLSFLPALAKRAGWLSAAALLGVVSPTAGSAQAQGAAPTRGATVVDHAPFDRLLQQWVTDGMVDYDAFATSPDFARYLASLAAAQPDRMSRADQLAFWINTYNAYTIQLINSRKERRSIRNINKRFGVTFKSPWAEPIVKAGGATLTLDDVEHTIVRPTFKDPRIHVALVCAAKGCPPLRSEAFVGSRIDVQLDDQARRFLAQTMKNRVDVAARTVYGSPIFTWYREDFGGTLVGVGAFWARFLPDGAARDLVRSGAFRWVDTEYDWTLNLRVVK
ncbi:VTT domain-containing protein [Gemmatimonas sp.]|uniref:DUF547 domain-containing protein n=1 Tax=Gemmatimonas sp. TaxID=1962908 RepID=UPI00333F7B0D